MNTSKSGTAFYNFDARNKGFLHMLNYGVKITQEDLCLSVQCILENKLAILIRKQFLYIKKDKEKYGIGEDVKLILYLEMKIFRTKLHLYPVSKRIVHYDVSNSSTHTFEFLEDYMPNVYATSVCFTGRTYISTRRNIVYDMEEKSHYCRRNR